MKKFTIAREGTFTTAAVAGTPHCGLKDGPVEFRYSIRICCLSIGLDKDGFVVDNSELQKVWDGFKLLTMSCENLCRAVANRLVLQFAGRESTLLSIEVQIWGLATASATFSWDFDGAEQPWTPPSPARNIAQRFVPISGNTYPVRNEIKALGGRWDAASKSWMVPEDRADEALRLTEAAPASGRTTRQRRVD